MVYSVPSARPFVTSKSLKKRTVLSKEEVARREFNKTHKIEIYLDAESGEPVCRATRI